VDVYDGLCLDCDLQFASDMNIMREEERKDHAFSVKKREAKRMIRRF
jgi:hypothetical protein